MYDEREKFPDPRLFSAFASIGIFQITVTAVAVKESSPQARSV